MLTLEEASKEEIDKLIDFSKTALITFTDKTGCAKARAMYAPRKRVGLKEMYFMSTLSSEHALCLLKNKNGCVYFYQERKRISACFMGEFEILSDKKIKEMLWRHGDIATFPLGVYDPDYCVLIFRASCVRFYKDYKSVDFNLE